MNTHAETIVLAVVFAVGTAGAPYVAGAGGPMPGVGSLHVGEGVNASPQGGTPPPVVKGELLKIDGPMYVVKDRTGREIRFLLDERTLMNAHPKVGDMIKADIEPQGYAYSINMAGN